MDLPDDVIAMFIGMSVIWLLTCAFPDLSVTYNNIFERIKVIGKGWSPSSSFRDKPLTPKEMMKSIIWTWLVVVLLPTVIAYLWGLEQ